jgi:hypothetical protein
VLSPEQECGAEDFASCVVIALTFSRIHVTANSIRVDRFKQPFLIALQNLGNLVFHVVRRQTKPIDNPAEQSLIHIEHLRETVLP